MRSFFSISSLSILACTRLGFYNCGSPLDEDEEEDDEVGATGPILGVPLDHEET